MRMSDDVGSIPAKPAAVGWHLSGLSAALEAAEPLAPNVKDFDALSYRYCDDFVMFLVVDYVVKRR